MASLEGLRDLTAEQARLLGILPTKSPHKPKPSGLRDSERPALPIVLAGGVIPEGKKSWMKGKVYRDSQLGALDVSRGKALGEGTVDLGEVAAAAWHEATREPLSKVARPINRPKSDPYADWQPPVPGRKATKLTPR